MAARSGKPVGAEGNLVGEDVLAPILLPFTIVSDAAPALTAPRERSWGSQLGLWWTEADDAEGGVLVTGIMPGGAAERAGGITVGDRLLEIGETRITSLGDVVRSLERQSNSVCLQVKSVADGVVRTHVLQIAQGMDMRDPRPAPIAPIVPAAHVPVTTLESSIRGHIECVLSNPLQHEVKHPGVAADPDFGCLGADLEFSLQAVGLSEMRNAIVHAEQRLTDLELASVDIEVRRSGEVTVRPGVRVTARNAATGEPIVVEFEIETVTRRRQVYRQGRRARLERSGS